jgi:hypothetical protein
VLIWLIDGCACASEDGVGGEPGHRGASRQALPVAAPGDRGALAGTEFPAQGAGRAGCVGDSAGEPVAGGCVVSAQGTYHFPTNDLLANEDKYLLYWAPVNPITAVTYFMPAYGNHPFIIQYAMRALESHSVDVMFFYVYQIVQTLRYDVLGYVERYIIETAKFSQLFAHQIIWNMKANAFKDEASEIVSVVEPFGRTVLTV